jgi:hypothetical protein
MVEHLLCKHKVQTLVQKKKEKWNQAEGVAQVVEHLPSKHEAPSSNPNTAKKKKKVESVRQPCRSHYNIFSTFLYILKLALKNS